MAKSGEQLLTDVLHTRRWQDIDKVLTDAPSMEAVAIWHRFGRDVRKCDKAWLNRQLRGGDYSTLGLMCLVAGFAGARQSTLMEVLNIFRVIADELEEAAKAKSVRRQGDPAAKERQHPAVLQDLIDSTPPIVHRHD
jgi:hypothetical protein